MCLTPDHAIIDFALSVCCRVDLRYTILVGSEDQRDLHRNSSEMHARVREVSDRKTVIALRLHNSMKCLNNGGYALACINLCGNEVAVYIIYLLRYIPRL